MKRLFLCMGFRLVRPLPRPPSRGLIEALTMVIQEIGQKALPRPPSRGLIEAWANAIRRLNVAKALPRPPSRGLIEAVTYSEGGTTVASSSPATEPGPH